MVLRLDPARPLVWRTPFSLQLGVEPPVIVLDGLSPADEVVIELLRSGVTPELLAGAVAANGWDGARVDRLLRRLAPALGGPAARPLDGLEVALDGDPRDTTELHRLLISLGAEVVSAADREADADELSAHPMRPDADPHAPGARRRLGVVLSHYGVAPRAAARWLRADVPHLLVRFGDRSIHVGPVVAPGTGPCATCLELEHTDRDPSWPALAAQLSRRRAPSADASGLATLAPVVARILSASGDPGWSSRVVRLPRLVHSDPGDVGSAPPTEWIEELAPVTPHPRCGCLSPRGNATVPGCPSGAIRPPPTTERGAARPG